MGYMFTLIKIDTFLFINLILNIILSNKTDG